eukprot:GHVT01079598.1.p1 GENE.GHVT01079598.1~~GHVT01079598.1.p1  ORF type:complete len:632 (-),score=51.68 GHVT01079598.1:926-2821(-)
MVDSTGTVAADPARCCPTFDLIDGSASAVSLAGLPNSWAYQCRAFGHNWPQYVLNETSSVCMFNTARIRNISRMGSVDNLEGFSIALQACTSCVTAPNPFALLPQLLLASAPSLPSSSFDKLEPNVAVLPTVRLTRLVPPAGLLIPEARLGEVEVPARVRPDLSAVARYAHDIFQSLSGLVNATEELLSPILVHGNGFGEFSRMGSGKCIFGHNFDVPATVVNGTMAICHRTPPESAWPLLLKNAVTVPALELFSNCGNQTNLEELGFDPLHLKLKPTWVPFAFSPDGLHTIQNGTILFAVVPPHLFAALSSHSGMWNREQATPCNISNGSYASEFSRSGDVARVLLRVTGHRHGQVGTQGLIDATNSTDECSPATMHTCLSPLIGIGCVVECLFFAVEGTNVGTLPEFATAGQLRDNSTVACLTPLLPTAGNVNDDAVEPLVLPTTITRVFAYVNGILAVESAANFTLRWIDGTVAAPFLLSESPATVLYGSTGGIRISNDTSSASFAVLKHISCTNDLAVVAIPNSSLKDTGERKRMILPLLCSSAQGFVRLYVGVSLLAQQQVEDAQSLQQPRMGSFTDSWTLHLVSHREDTSFAKMVRKQMAGITPGYEEKMTIKRNRLQKFKTSIS